MTVADTKICKRCKQVKSIRRFSYRRAVCYDCRNRMAREQRQITPLTNTRRYGGVVVQCPQCGQEFKASPSRIKNGRSKYCSRACSSAMKAERYKGRIVVRLFGESNPNWRGVRAEKSCPMCSKVFRGANATCSEECGHQLQGVKIQGTNNPWAKVNPPIFKNCRRCKKEFKVQPGRINEAFYCSLDCAMRSHYLSARQVTLAKQLEERGYTVEMEKSWPWLRSPHSSQKLRVDIFLPEQNIAIEYDGRQHREVAFAGGNERLIRIKERDAHKELLLKQNAIPLIRLSEWPIDMDKLLALIGWHGSRRVSDKRVSQG